MLQFKKDYELQEYIESGKKLPDNFVYDGLTMSKKEEVGDKTVYSDTFDELTIEVDSNGVTIHDFFEENDLDY